MKLVLFNILLFLVHVAFAQEDCKCQSQLVRVELENDAVNGLINSSSLKPSLENFLNSDAFKSKVLTDYPMESMGFPHHYESCVKEKQDGDPKFADIDCDSKVLCSDPDVSDEVKAEVCVAFPCAMILGSQNMDKCPSKALARPGKLHYIEPVKMKQLSMNPTRITADKDTIKACFEVDKMEVSIGMDIEFNEDPDVKYERLGMENLILNLDQKREVCISGKLNLGAPEPLKDVKIENMSGKFISDSMINQTLSGARIRGLAGYSPATLSILKANVAPALARHFRPSLEEAVSRTLASTFQTQVAGFLEEVSAGKNTQIQTTSNSFISEMGVANIAVKKYVDLMDCSLLKHERKPIPKDHSCMNQLYPFRKKELRVKDIPSPAETASMLKDQLSQYDQVTSEKLKNDILSLQNRMSATPLDRVFERDLRPLANMIAINQANSNLISGVQLVSHLEKQNSMSGFGLSVPDICDVLNPSNHAGRSIPNCPVQTYLDTDELNRLLNSMFESGRLCHSGKGHFQPQLNSRGETVRNRDDSPRGDGCLLIIEEDEGGMRCFLNGAPQLNFDPVSRGIKVELKTRECYRGAVALGQGKIGGDINFEIGFRPAICGEGDFCLEDGNANWNVVPGTARGALRDSSWLNGIVRRTIDKKLNEMISKSIRVPLSGNSGPASMVPLKPEGRLDIGPGYFGACLEPK